MNAMNATSEKLVTPNMTILCQKQTGSCMSGAGNITKGEIKHYNTVWDISSLFVIVHPEDVMRWKSLATSVDILDTI